MKTINAVIIAACLCVGACSTSTPSSTTPKSNTTPDAETTTTQNSDERWDDALAAIRALAIGSDGIDISIDDAVECARAEQRLYDLSADYLDERAVEELSAPEDEYGSIAWIRARIAEAEAGEEVEEDEFFSTPLYTSASLQDQLAQAEESLEKAKASLADTYTKTSEVVADVLAACLPVVPNDWGISIVQSVASVIAECEIWAEDTGSHIKCRQ